MRYNPIYDIPLNTRVLCFDGWKWKIAEKRANGYWYTGDGELYDGDDPLFKCWTHLPASPG